MNQHHNHIKTNKSIFHILKLKSVWLVIVVVLGCLSSVKAQGQTWVTWNDQREKSNTITGTANVGGVTVTATVIATSNTSASGSWPATTQDNSILLSGNNWDVIFPSLGNLQSNFGVPSTNNFFISNHYYIRYPSIITVKFDKPVILSKFGVDDVDTGGGTGWSESHNISGYTFSSTTSGNWDDTPAPTVTNSSVTFSSNTTITSDLPGDGYIIYNGTAVLPAGTPVVLTYTGQKFFATNNVSNKNNGYAIALSPPCNAGSAPPTLSPTSATICSGSTYNLT